MYTAELPIGGSDTRVIRILSLPYSPDDRGTGLTITEVTDRQTILNCINTSFCDSVDMTFIVQEMHKKIRVKAALSQIM
jgi:hypothetical protein